MRIAPTAAELVELTAAWSGERFADGRPRVPDDVLRSLRDATVEQVWHVLQDNGYPPQFVGGWRQTRPGQTMVGRCVTAQFLPLRPDFDAAVKRAGEREGFPSAATQNTWVVDSLQQNDVFIADIFGKIREGTVIGDNLGGSIAVRTGVGGVIDGGVRDLAGLVEIPAPVNFFYRDTDPTPIEEVTLAGMNIPVRIGAVTVLPGDIALGTIAGVSFIPSHLAELVAERSEDIRRRDRFARQRLAERRYTTAEIDVSVWPPDIEGDFQTWLGAAT